MKISLIEYKYETSWATFTVRLSWSAPLRKWNWWVFKGGAPGRLRGHPLFGTENSFSGARKKARYACNALSDHLARHAQFLNDPMVKWYIRHD